MRSPPLPPLTPHSLLTRAQLRVALGVGEDEVRRLWPLLPRKRLPGRRSARAERVLYGDALALMEHIEPEAKAPDACAPARPRPAARRRRSGLAA